MKDNCMHNCHTLDDCHFDFPDGSGRIIRRFLDLMAEYLKRIFTPESSYIQLAPLTYHEKSIFGVIKALVWITISIMLGR